MPDMSLQTQLRCALKIRKIILLLRWSTASGQSKWNYSFSYRCVQLLLEIAHVMLECGEKYCSKQPCKKSERQTSCDVHLILFGTCLIVTKSSLSQIQFESTTWFQKICVYIPQSGRSLMWRCSEKRRTFLPSSWASSEKWGLGDSGTTLGARSPGLNRLLSLKLCLWAAQSFSSSQNTVL